MADFRGKVEHLVDGLNAIDDVSCLMPGGTFYVFPSVKRICNRYGITSHGLALFLLEAADGARGVACLGGECFGEAGGGFLRLMLRRAGRTALAGGGVHRGGGHPRRAHGVVPGIAPRAPPAGTVRGRLSATAPSLSRCQCSFVRQMVSLLEEPSSCQKKQSRNSKKNRECTTNGRQLKHLELLQAEVGRFTSESLRIKTTTVPIVLAAAGLAIRIDTPSFDLVVLLLVVPVLLFWFLDGYVVKQQQLFRWRYNRVRLLQDSKVDFNMCVRLPLAPISSQP